MSFSLLLLFLSSFKPFLIFCKNMTLIMLGIPHLLEKYCISQSLEARLDKFLFFYEVPILFLLLSRLRWLGKPAWYRMETILILQLRNLVTAFYKCTLFL